MAKNIFHLLPNKVRATVKSANKQARRTSPTQHTFPIPSHRPPKQHNPKYGNQIKFLIAFRVERKLSRS